QVQPRRESRRYVLHTVHGEIDLLAQQGVFDVLHKQPLAANARQRVMTVSVPGGANHHEFGRESRVLLPQGLSHPTGLPEGHGTTAGAKTDVAIRWCHDYTSKLKRRRTTCTASRTCPSGEARLR